MQFYCSECGHGTPYTLKKPDKCEKCFTSFAVVETTARVKRRLDIEVEDDEPEAPRKRGRRYNLAFEVDRKPSALRSQDIVGLGGNDFAGVKSVDQINMRSPAKMVSDQELMQQLRDECKSSRATPIEPTE